MPKYVFEGIVLYTIEKHGCLNGVYTNEHKTNGGEIHNEICRKINWKEQDQNILEGLYDCFFFDNNNERCNATLEITRTNRIYYFSWKDFDSKKESFKGVGFKMNERQLVVHYTD